MTDLNDRWFDQCTAADVAYAINQTRARVRHVSPNWVKQRWSAAQKRGDLPPNHRPPNGFDPVTAQLLRKLMGIVEKKRAA